ncbi:MAG: 2-oxoacid:acceptor oxidoreductase family protein [Deferrisomatales bacterium]
MLEIKFSGRGGQGVVVASQILGLAFFKEGRYPQCYSLFGGERRGAPVVGFLRVDDEKILLKCEIRHPRDLICLDDGLFDAAEARGLLLPGGRILVNTRKPLAELGDLAGFAVGRVDALAISEEVGLGKMINTTVLGAYCRLAGWTSLGPLLEAVAESVPARVDANVQAARLAFDRVELTQGDGR